MSGPQQLTLIVEPRARHDDPDTSGAAAAKVGRGSMLERIRHIASIVDAAGEYGCTADECWQTLCVEDETYWRPRRSTAHKRFSDAAQAGLIVPLGRKHSRLSVLGSIQRIHCAPRFTEEGKQ